MKTLVKGGRILDPKNQIDEVADLFIADKTICGIGSTPSGFTADRILDAEDKIVCPGFIEIGCDLEGLSPDTFNVEQELMAATAGGFTVVSLLPISTGNFEQQGSIGREKGRSGKAKVKHLGSFTLEQKGEVLSEMEALKTAGCIGLATNGRSVINTSVLRNALAYASSLDLLILLDSHDAWLNDGGIMRSGPSSIMAGLAGIPNSSELIGLMRNLILVEEIGVRAHMRNLSVSESAVLIARFSGAKVSSDVSISHLALCDENIDSCDPNFKVIPPLPTKTDQDILLAQLSKGEIDILSSKHQPITADYKSGTFESSKPGISGFDTFLSLMLRIADSGKITLPRLIEAATSAPAKAMGIDGGDLSINSKADICVFDPNLMWVADKENFKSLGQNNPLFGTTLKGKVTQTLIDGNIIYDYQKPQKMTSLL
tara:strand:- start:3516 stop:4802 length:1287 start_codon:yes stop_codon:yes gene_type:complete